MKKLTEREIARLLAARATPEPPAGLADRIKAEIPGTIRLERPSLHPGRRWLMPPPVAGLQPGWIAAASVLLVLGVGMVAARIPSQPDDVWKWMALSGVVHIDDVVVTAPAPTEPQTTAVAAAQARASKGVRVTVPSRQKVLSDVGAARPVDELAIEAKTAAGAPFAPERETVAAAEPWTETAGLPSQAGKEAAADRATVVGRAEAPRAEVAMTDRAIAERAVSAGAMPAPAPADRRRAVPFNRATAARADAANAEEENTVTVLVVDESGGPREGVTVTLERLGQGATGRWTADTDASGTATFRGVPLSMYRVVAAAPAIAPAQMVITVASERAPTRAEMRVRALPRR